jgi:predicted small secreted protein
MRKKKLFAGALLLSFILLSGCETSKGAAVGMGGAVASTASGVAEDSKNLWQSILKADKWMRDNLW